jgi:hypothetical protein
VTVPIIADSSSSPLAGEFGDGFHHTPCFGCAKQRLAQSLPRLDMEILHLQTTLPRDDKIPQAVEPGPDQNQSSHGTVKRVETSAVHRG